MMRLLLIALVLAKSQSEDCVQEPDVAMMLQANKKPEAPESTDQDNKKPEALESAGPASQKTKLMKMPCSGDQYKVAVDICSWEPQNALTYEDCVSEMCEEIMAQSRTEQTHK
mmetsp:Transcript_6661/g.8234  ORF Transcript_6661/g.8234 Transcript_6661/m.8234 type:complete len:113 (+) Transcript_6661:48-386(+)